MGTSLEDALNGENTSENDVGTVEAEPIAQSSDDVQAGDNLSAEPEPSEDEPKGWQYAAYKDEKTKRQELENQLREKEQAIAEAQRQAQEYEAYLQQIQAQQQQHQDPQGYQVQELVSQQVGAVEAQTRLRMSRMLASQSHGAEKVQAAEDAFKDLARTNPVEYQALVAQFGIHDDPIGQVMNWHKRYDMLNKMGDDPDAYIQAQVQAKLAELQNMPDPQTGTAPRAAPVMPTDLSQTRNVGSRSGSNWSGPTPLSDVLGE